MKIVHAAIAAAFAMLLAAAPTTASDTANIQVVQGYYAAINAADLDEAVTFLADDVVFINPTGSYIGLEAARQSLVTGIADKISFDLTNFQDVDGRVTYDYVVKMNGAAIETGTTGLTWVRAGKIVFDGTTDTEALWEH